MVCLTCVQPLSPPLFLFSFPSTHTCTSVCKIHGREIPFVMLSLSFVIHVRKNALDVVNFFPLCLELSAGNALWSAPIYFLDPPMVGKPPRPQLFFFFAPRWGSSSLFFKLLKNWVLALRAAPPLLLGNRQCKNTPNQKCHIITNFTKLAIKPVDQRTCHTRTQHHHHQVEHEPPSTPTVKQGKSIASA